MLKINPNISIFIQLADHIRIEIFSKLRKPGSQLESIRDMAIELEVNPNTIKRVYQELISEELIYTNGTLGNFVTENEELIEMKKMIFLEEKTKDYLDIIKSCNENEELFIEFINKQYKK